MFAGEYGSIAPIAAVVTATGYDVAWKVPGPNQYVVWTVDGNGNETSNATGGSVSESSAALENFETIFHQDLNGDGAIGPPTIVIDTNGAVSLVQVGSNYFLNPASGGTGPELKESVARMCLQESMARIAPIAAVVTATGYDVAWKVPGADQYVVWTVDGNGNETSNATGGAVSGSSAAFENFETIFHQDLNGDGVIGPPTIVIDTNGAVSLVQVGGNYFLNPASGGTGPELKDEWLVCVCGRVWLYRPNRGRCHSHGLRCCLESPWADQYVVWTVDGNGNETSNATGGSVSGSSAALENFRDHLPSRSERGWGYWSSHHRHRYQWCGELGAGWKQLLFESCLRRDGA